MSGFRVGLVLDGHDGIGSDFSSVYFKDQAQEASSRLVAQGKLQEGEKYKYAVAAFPVEKPPEGEPDVPFNVEDVSPAFPVQDGSMQELLARSRACGTLDEDDLPLFVPERVLEESAALAHDAGARETAGMWIGHLRRDPVLAEMFAVVEAQVPATHARGELASVTFTAETWTAVKATVDLRRRNEIFLGFWHSHPVDAWQCGKCPIERRRRCPLAVDFFSAHDRALFRTVFPRAYSAALVVNRLSGDEHTYSCFGWREGLIQSRGFYVVNGFPGPSEDDGPRAA